MIDITNSVEHNQYILNVRLYGIVYKLRTLYFAR